MSHYDIRDIPGLWCDDIMFCPEQCGERSCPRNKQNIRDRTIPHSFSVEIPADCPKRQESMRSGMPDREKVISALHCRAYDDDFPCWKCAYYKQDEKPVARCDYRGLMDDAISLLKEQKEEIIHCKDCYYYHKPEYGFTIGDCTYRTAWYPVKENEFCSLAKRKEGR